MSYIRIDELTIKNYRSFGHDEQTITFPNKSYKKPVAIIGYNNAGKTNLMNAILYGVGENFANEETFDLKDFYNLNWENIPFLQSNISSSVMGQNSWGKDISMEGTHELNIEVDANTITECSIKPSFYGANKRYSIFYINFHAIKDQISTKKSSWGRIKSFLGKHLKKLIETDPTILKKKDGFVKDLDEVIRTVKKDTNLNAFIEDIKQNLENNLRDKSCDIDFTLPEYEDIFLEMIFKIGIGGDKDKLIPLDRLGDGYISMFVMAVIQTIAESNDDKCLFLFEEPESFLHENHQEYFYKNVLCRIAENGHQVIYTTHSDKMIDIFDTRGIIRLEFDQEEKQTVVKYNNPDELESIVSPIKHWRQFLNTVEPNLNKLLFSQKVILVEGPDDVMAYKYAIQKKVKEKCVAVDYIPDEKELERFSETYLNLHNIVILPHHGKSTAELLINLCNHFHIDCFVISDWDLPASVDLKPENLLDIVSKDSLATSVFYAHADESKKGQITNNWKLTQVVQNNQIHFNNPKLEAVLGFEKKNPADEDSLDYKKKGDSFYLWEKLQETNFDQNFFPESLFEFLRISNIGDDQSSDVKASTLEQAENESSETVVAEEYSDDIPF